MDNDLILGQFEEIEQKVDRLIGVCKTLETQKIELADKVANLEATLQQKVEEEKRLEAEKTLIRSKIDSLLARLEDITESSS
ncbi:hypothetical protein D3OALGA1CA_4875 [Olavius algarvensis associated proteobacterium Delta 3]|nr:hypothetical protein D3OALGB2SA_731 [Olavius algarvensis associated proteobacterium Delta 3]CAB5158204.1 hypothetical protein D3OALGA1CA_4875 [Olavius algarvensis associated proteobacterium Delta 3]